MTDMTTSPFPRRTPQVRDLLPPRDADAKSLNPEAFAPPAERVRLAEIERELSRSPLDEIAARLAQLTYGDMKQYCEGTASECDKVWAWATGRGK
jgi:hypothetical protein